jgi:hypothetical protein
MTWKQALLEVPDKVAFRNELLAQFPMFFDLDENGEPYSKPNHRFNYQPTNDKGLWHILVSKSDWDLLKTGTWTTCSILVATTKAGGVYEALRLLPAKLAVYKARVYHKLLIDDEQNPKAYEFMIRNTDTGEIRKYWEAEDELGVDEEKVENPQYEDLKIAGEWA